MILHILVCDDDPAFVARLSDWLRQNTARDLNPDVHTCTDPAALTDAELSTFDIIFLDIDMGPATASRWPGGCGGCRPAPCSSL